MEQHTTPPNPANPISDAEFFGQKPVEYAGFWLRFVAALIDGLLLMVVQYPLTLLFGPNNVYTYTENGFEIHTENSPMQIVSVLIGWLYFAYMESSTKQATLGKQALGLIVTDEQGNRITFAKATGRHFSKILSAMILFVGYIMAGFTAKKQALHDLIASTLVVKK